MTDPLDDLKRAFERATPAPDAERRKANLARAQELFDRVQDSEAESRRTDDRTKTWAGIEQGVRHMLNALTSRPVLAVVSAVAAVGLTALLVTATRTETPPPGIVVADAGVEPEPVVTRADAPVAERPTPVPTEEPRAVADADQPESRPLPTEEPTATETSLREVGLPADSDASEAVATALDHQAPTVDHFELPEAPLSAEERLAAVAPRRDQSAESFDATIAEPGETEGDPEG